MSVRARRVDGILEYGTFFLEFRGSGKKKRIASGKDLVYTIDIKIMESINRKK